MCAQEQTGVHLFICFLLILAWSHIPGILQWPQQVARIYRQITTSHQHLKWIYHKIYVRKQRPA